MKKFLVTESELCSEANKESLEDRTVVFTSAFVANNSLLSNLQLPRADAAERASGLQGGGCVYLSLVCYPPGPLELFWQMRSSDFRILP